METEAGEELSLFSHSYCLSWMDDAWKIPSASMSVQNRPPVFKRCVSCTQSWEKKNVLHLLCRLSLFICFHLCPLKSLKTSSEPVLIKTFIIYGCDHQLSDTKSKSKSYTFALCSVFLQRSRLRLIWLFSVMSIFLSFIYFWVFNGTAQVQPYLHS